MLEEGTSPLEINPDSRVLRRVFSSNHVKGGSRLDHRAFMPKSGNSAISVDLLVDGRASEHRDLAEAAAPSGRNFHGWGVVPAPEATESGRRLDAMPVPDENPYHFDLVFPDDALEEKDILKQHAHDLAAAATWLSLIHI